MNEHYYPWAGNAAEDRVIERLDARKRPPPKPRGGERVLLPVALAAMA